MRRFNVTNSESGFTLLEQLIVLVLVGILGAFSGPSMIGMMQRGDITQATDKIRSVLQIAQRNAIMKSATCTLTLPTQNTALVKSGSTIPVAYTITSNPADCLPMMPDEQRFPQNMTLSYTSSTISLDYQGKTTANNLIIITHKDNSSFKKCLQVSQPLGLVRVGDYDGTNCVAAQ